MNKIIPLILLCLILFSCEKALDIELPSRKSRLVVNSYLITDQFWDNKNQFLLLSNSISGMGTLDDFIYTDSLPLIDFGTVIINEIDKDGVKDNSKSFSALSHFPILSYAIPLPSVASANKGWFVLIWLITLE